MLEFGDHGSDFVQGAALRQPPGQFHIALLERPREAAHSISMLLNILALGLVEDVPGVGPGVAEWLDEGEEALQSVLKKDVTLPERIVGINKQSQPPHLRTCDSLNLCGAIMGSHVFLTLNCCNALRTFHLKLF